MAKTLSQPVINCILGGFVLSRRLTIFRCLLNIPLAMINPERYSPQFSAENLRSAGAPANLSRRRFLQALGLTGISTMLPVASGVSSLILPQGAEAAESSRSINWKEVLGQFGESVVIPGERDESGADMIVGRTMNEIYKLYLRQQEDWCAVEAANCEGEVDHARRDNRVLVPSDYMLSVPLELEGGGDSINLPLNGYITAQNIADFAEYADDILGLSGKYSDLQMVDENGELRPLLLSKQGVPVFFSAEELLFIYAHYRMNKVTAEEMESAGKVLDYGGNASAAQARGLRYERIGNVRAAGMNNLQTALSSMFAHYRYINGDNEKSVDSTAPFVNYRTMTENWNQDLYWKGGRKISAEQSQARIRAMLAKDPEPLGKAGQGVMKWWSSAEFVPPTLTNGRGNKFSAENPIDFVNAYADKYFANDPERDLKAMMLLANLQLKDQFDYYVQELNGGDGENARVALQTTKALKDSKLARWMNQSIKRPRDFLIEEGPVTTIAQN